MSFVPFPMGSYVMIVEMIRSVKDMLTFRTDLRIRFMNHFVVSEAFLLSKPLGALCAREGQDVFVHTCLSLQFRVVLKSFSVIQTEMRGWFVILLMLVLGTVCRNSFEHELHINLKTEC